MVACNGGGSTGIKRNRKNVKLYNRQHHSSPPSVLAILFFRPPWSSLERFLPPKYSNNVFSIQKILSCHCKLTLPLLRLLSTELFVLKVSPELFLLLLTGQGKVHLLAKKLKGNWACFLFRLVFGLLFELLQSFLCAIFFVEANSALNTKNEISLQNKSVGYMR